MTLGGLLYYCIINLYFPLVHSVCPLPFYTKKLPLILSKGVPTVYCVIGLTFQKIAASLLQNHTFLPSYIAAFNFL